MKTPHLLQYPITHILMLYLEKKLPPIYHVFLMFFKWLGAPHVSQFCRAHRDSATQGATSCMFHNGAKGCIDSRLPSCSLGNLMQVVLLEKAWQCTAGRAMLHI